jgi:hypothetical protein
MVFEAFTMVYGTITMVTKPETIVLAPGTLESVIKKIFPVATATYS